jgi:alpha-L-arabinofuranosidase
MMKAEIRASGPASAYVPISILGQNLEMAGDTAAGLLTDRLTNSRFLGPADLQTGLAPGWQPGMSHNCPGIRFELTAGMSLSGYWSQLLHNYSGRSGVGMVQTQRWVQAGERLIVSLWARAQHRPAVLSVGLRPLDARKRAYDERDVLVETTYWRRYETVLTVPENDDKAVFTCMMNQPGMVWVDQIHLRPERAGTIRQDLMDAWRELGMPVLRFPGGCISTNYHWKLGTGPQHLRPVMPDPVFKWDTSYEFGTDEYLAVCQALGVRPHLTVNVGSGTPEEAAAWAAYCRSWYAEQGLEPPSAYVGIGNEHWGAWELGNMTGAMYARALQDFVPGIRDAYPEARIVALGPKMGEALLPQERVPWRGPVLQGASGLVDLLALQHYVGVQDDDPELELAKAIRGIDVLVDEIIALAADCEAAGTDIRAAVTEWNLWRQASHHDDRGFLEPQDVTHALFVAATLNAFCRLSPALELANHYHLLNPMGLYIGRGPDLQVAPAVDVFRLYARALPGRRVPIDVVSPHLAEVGDGAAVSALDAVCIQGESETWVVAANRHAAREIEAELAELGEIREVIAFVGAPDAVTWAPYELAWKPNELVIPPRSLVGMRLASD